MSLEEVLANIRSSPQPPNEVAARFRIIGPILYSLGWDVSGPQVLHEHSVGDNRGGGRVDMALQGVRGVVALIEAKAPGADLSSHVSQVLGYAFHEGVDICALTTGMEWWLYLPREQGRPEERRFRILNITDDQLDELADDFRDFLGQVALETGEAVEKAEGVLRAQRQRALLNEQIPNIWRRMIEEANEELVEVVTRQVYRELDLRPDRDLVAGVLRRANNPVTTAPVRPDRSVEPRQVRSTRQVAPPGGSSPTGRRPRRIVLFGEGHQIRSHIEGLEKLVEGLLQRHPEVFSGAFELRGRRRVYLSRDTTHMHSPRRVGSSEYFMETNFSAPTILRVAGQLLSQVGRGYSDSDFEFAYD